MKNASWFKILTLILYVRLLVLSRLLKRLTLELQTSEVDLSLANISVHLDVGKGGNSGSNAIAPTIEFGTISVVRVGVQDKLIKVGKHIYARNGVLTEIKKFGTVHLGYGIKKLDGKYYKDVAQHILQFALLSDLPLPSSSYINPAVLRIEVLFSGNSNADDHDGYSQYKQGASLLEQRRPATTMAPCKTSKHTIWLSLPG
uniref:Uncharacterized protein n=1 Tax=Chenopodium quinoa TaxID=63459 RepID=A0A803N1R3_CHEQI